MVVSTFDSLFYNTFEFSINCIYSNGCKVYIHPWLIIFVITVPVTSFNNVACFSSGIGAVFGGQISGIPQRWDSALVGHIRKKSQVQQAGHDGMGGIGTAPEIRCLLLKLYILKYY